MENPFAAAYKAGWNLGEEFVNMFLGHGGEFFKAGTALPNLNNETGVAALTKMKGLTEYMNPDYLTLESEGIKLGMGSRKCRADVSLGFAGTDLAGRQGLDA